MCVVGSETPSEHHGQTTGRKANIEVARNALVSRILSQATQEHFIV